MENGFLLEGILLIVTYALWIVAAIILVLALVKGKKDMQKYHFFNIIGLSFLGLGGVVYLIRDYLVYSSISIIGLLLFILNLNFNWF
ncbi:hypothetical protein AZF37_06305 [endosymbiont 'TC1' of Trimyema compressum]|uniref:hypothetical protein n=1 Tax=endosymbiont 'TC1' of Trimyema compressum TaxID=243899 RepID=UPI0007F121AC|nr:hypothetical protein [endosymbiont 'TC1' of Trimyema compressum]AMP20835.1 hypothetical protein AZF37_06305 [endosymbiont 'TC1' of Trimyema compressum]